KLPTSPPCQTRKELRAILRPDPSVSPISTPFSTRQRRGSPRQPSRLFPLKRFSSAWEKAGRASERAARASKEFRCGAIRNIFTENNGLEHPESSDRSVIRCERPVFYRNRRQGDQKNAPRLRERRPTSVSLLR